jgi:exodeoxyribonuclease VII large subunit
VTATVVSVSELNRRARQLLEGEFPLQWVIGEVSNLSRAASGHVYFSLKDESAQLRCVMFRSRAQLVPWQLANGQQVEVCGLVSLYEARGDFQFGVETMRRAGLGRLYEAFARLKQQLEAEGLFADQRKRKLPPYPLTVAIVSSPQAAALQDVMAAFQRRAPHVELTLYPTAVQGAGAAEEIVQAIRRADNEARADLLLLVRGGGSLEDLWSFNDEAVARALAACRLPSIVGVGHETDTTIADWVADVRAATPTAAAEIATTHWVAAVRHLDMLEQQLHRAVRTRLDQLHQQLDDYMRRLTHPAQRLARLRERIASNTRRLQGATITLVQHRRQTLLLLQARLERQRPRTELLRHRLATLNHGLDRAVMDQIETLRRRLTTAASALSHLNPDATLARGYAIVRDETGRIVCSSTQLHVGDSVALRFGSGTANARIEILHNAPTSKP